MGYSAYGGLSADLNKDKEEELKTALVEFIESFGVHCESKTVDLSKLLKEALIETGFEDIEIAETDKLCVEGLYCYGHYTDSVPELFSVLAPFTISGIAEFTGEDDTHWRFQYDKDKKEWIEENAELVYESDLPKPLPEGVTFENNGYYPSLRIKVPGGHLVAYVGNGETQQAGVMYIPDMPDGTMGPEVDLLMAEVKSDELAGRKNNKDIDLYMWADPYDEDYTDRAVILREEVLKTC